MIIWLSWTWTLITTLMLYFLYFFLSPYTLFCSFSDVSRNVITAMTSRRRWLRDAVDRRAKLDGSLTRAKESRGKVCLLAVLLDVLYVQHTQNQAHHSGRGSRREDTCDTTGLFHLDPPTVWWSKVAPEAGGTFPPSEGGGGSAEKPDCHPEPDGLICTPASLRWVDPYTCFNRCDANEPSVVWFCWAFWALWAV